MKLQTITTTQQALQELKEFEIAKSQEATKEAFFIDSVNNEYKKLVNAVNLVVNFYGKIKVLKGNKVVFIDSWHINGKKCSVDNLSEYLCGSKTQLHSYICDSLKVVKTFYNIIDNKAIYLLDKFYTFNQLFTLAKNSDIGQEIKTFEEIDGKTIAKVEKIDIAKVNELLKNNDIEKVPSLLPKTQTRLQKEFEKQQKEQEKEQEKDQEKPKTNAKIEKIKQILLQQKVLQSVIDKIIEIINE